MKEEIRVNLCCVGVAHAKGKAGLYPQWGALLPSGKVSEERLLWAISRKMQAGCIYSVAVPSLSEFQKGTVYTKTFRYVRTYPDRKKAAEWEARAIALQTAYSIDRRAREEERKGSALRESLAPLRSQYQKGNALVKAAIVGWIVAELQRKGEEE